MANLFSLFDERFKSAGDVAASPPQNLESLSEDVSEQELLLRKIRQFDEVRPKVDYSDFSNFVFFNSALDYFNITGEKILNEYPFDGGEGLIEAYLDDLDDYQRSVVRTWPRRVGHLRFNPAVSSSYVLIEDVGVEDNTQKTGMLSVGTGSWSVESWVIPPPALTGTEDVMVLMQKTGSAGEGYTTFFSGSRVHFRVKSGSLTDEVSAPVVAGRSTYLAFVLNRSATSGTVGIMTGSTEEFPVVASSAAVTVTGSMDMGHGYAFIGTGALTGKVVRPLTGSVDDVRVWNIPLTIMDVSSSFNTKLYATENLVAMWRFNESGSIRDDASRNAIVQDHSGHRINGRIVNYFTNIRGSGSLMNFDVPDLILSYDAPEVQALVLEQQTSGTVYDRSNDNIITRLMPDQFFQMEQEQNTNVLEKFLFVLARQFDFMKVRIDQFTNVLRTNYGEFDQAPDALLAEVAQFFGWEFTGNFLNADAFQYILGKNVLRNLDANKALEKKLYEIKNEFWRRTLNNLMHMYKTKGTRESVESLLRSYGVGDGIVKLKEYGYKPNGGFNTFRVSSEKSVYALGFGSGSLYGVVTSSLFSGALRTMEARLMFPLTSSSGIQASHLTGSIWHIISGSVVVNRLTYEKTSLSSPSGSLILSGTNFYVSMSAPIFDGGWYNVAAVMDELSGTVTLSARNIDDGVVYRTHSLSSSAVPDTATWVYRLKVGASASLGAQYWMQEVRFWDKRLEERDLNDHALNFQSYGTADPKPDNARLLLHWRLNENHSGSNTTVNDVSIFTRPASRVNFAVNPSYKKFLNEYNYIASPEYGLTEDKVRIVDATRVDPKSSFSENRIVSLEFNMIDALNEDISQIFSSMDVMNQTIGQAANKYREAYNDLESIREQYFKRLTDRLNFRVFADMLEFFDRSFVNMVRRLIPASVTFVGDEFVIESHMLERPKVQWNYRRQEKILEIEGVITVIDRGFRTIAGIISRG